jgi:hypothetical protein
VVDDTYTTTIALREGMILDQRAAARPTGLIYDVMTGRREHSADAPQ